MSYNDHTELDIDEVVIMNNNAIRCAMSHCDNSDSAARMVDTGKDVICQACAEQMLSLMGDEAIAIGVIFTPPHWVRQMRVI